MKQSDRQPRTRSAGEDAAQLLSYRARSVDELRQRLARKGHDAETIDRVLSNLQQQGLVDDEAFAKMWIDSRQRRTPSGSRRLAVELKRKGVAREIVEQAIGEAGDMSLLALEAGRKRARSLAGDDAAVFRRRLGGFLARRGFDFETVRETVDQLAREFLSGEAAE